MNNARQSILIAGVTMLCLVATLLATSSSILQGGFATIERDAVIADVEQALAVTADQLHVLFETTNDWAHWDDTYRYLADRNREYEEANLGDTSIAKIQMNLIAYLNLQGEIVFGRLCNLDDGSTQPLTPDVAAALAAEGPLCTGEEVDGKRVGLLVLDGQPMLVAARSILTSEEQGPARGTLVMGRYLTGKRLEKVASLARGRLSVQPAAGELPPDFAAALAAISDDEPIVVRAASDQEISGYTLVSDLHEQPALLVRVSADRTVYQHGRASMGYFSAITLTFGAVFSLIAWCWRA